MSVVASVWKIDDDTAGKTRLVWVSDPNPMRVSQIDMFNELNPDLALKLDPDNSGTMKVIVQSSAGMGPDLIGQVVFDRHPWALPGCRCFDGPDRGGTPIRI